MFDFGHFRSGVAFVNSMQLKTEILLVSPRILSFMRTFSFFPHPLFHLISHADISSSVHQVNIPKTRNTYCKGKTCKKHTPHKVTQYKTGKASLFAQGKRRYDRYVKDFISKHSNKEAWIFHFDF